MTGVTNMREINTELITDTIREMCIHANTRLIPARREKIEQAREREISPVGQGILTDMLDNLDCAESEGLPICQDTGMAVVFIDLGQDVHLTGEDLEVAVNEGVRRGYRDGYLRKSVVADPLRRKNTQDNTPAVLHTRIVPGDRIHLTVLPKGFGSENTSALKMLKPADGAQGVEDFIVEAILKAAPNACAPVSAGIGIGGTFEKAALESKRALCTPSGQSHPDPYYAGMEKRILERVQESGIGPMGLGGTETAVDVHIRTYPTHIAGLPVAVNICCWVDRIAEEVI